MRTALLLAALFFGSGCMTTPTARLNDAARDLNNAARFGRMDIAIESTASTARDAFLIRRTQWGGEIRVLDSNVLSARIQDSGDAKVTVAYDWLRTAESELRTTTIEQIWKTEGPTGWLLYEESRIGGDHGLWGEAVVELKPEAAPVTHFPTKRIQ